MVESTNIIKIGIFGVGHLGKIHVRLLQQLSDTYQIVGFFDPSDEASTYAITTFGISRFLDSNELIVACDCICVAAPTPVHFEIASSAVKRGKHVFIEKPITETLDEAKTLLSLSQEANVKVQVGHVERFNPAYIAAAPYIDQPLLITTNRLAQYNIRGTDVSVVLDLMIHDIDIALRIANSNIKKIVANGVAVISSTPDVANARIEFDNGCVANLTASRVALENERKTTIYQHSNYLSIDFLHQTSARIQLESPINSVKNGEQLEVKNPFSIHQFPVKKTNAIEHELLDFAQSILTDTSPEVGVDDALRAMDVAHQINEKLKAAIAPTFDNI